ncbi:MAG: FtsX-like permease family protein [Bacteroidales bacterium]|jgi:putative ABC transport system permease protein|nr:FtsX-like permease family protein [Bacteroidales bacterium]
MIRNYLKTALRNIARNKIHSFINIVGLAIGVSLFIIIALYVKYELTYDNFHQDKENIFRIERGEEGNSSIFLPSGMGIDVLNQFPEVEQMVRFKYSGNIIIENEDKTHKIPDFYLADSTVWDIFSFEFILGTPENALVDPFNIVLTESIAKQIFGNENPVNKIVKTNTGREYKISGIIKDIDHSHLRINAIGSFNLLGVLYGQDRLNNYKTNQYYTYLKLSGGINIEELESKIADYYQKRFPDYPSEDIAITLRNLSDAYFYKTSSINLYGIKSGNLKTVKIFIAIGLFIIIIACINFINLTTARATSRAKEVGLRKVAGSLKSNLIIQFLSESVLISFIAFLLAITIVQIFIPVFNNLILSNISFHTLFNVKAILLIIAGMFFIGLLSGIYPAFYLTAFNPVYVLKGEVTKGKSAALFRKILIVVQFTISVALIICTLTVYKQLNYLKNKNLGFNKDLVVALELNNTLRQSREVFKEKLLKHSGIKKVSYSMTIPGSGTNFEGFDFNSDGNSTTLQVHTIDPDYIDLFEIELLSGRNFNWNRKSDRKQKIILNERAVKEAGLTLENAPGTVFHRDSWYITALPSHECEIIGVAKDFHFTSLHAEIGPFGMVWNEDWFGYINIKIQGNNIPSTLKNIQKEWNTICSGIPFEYIFIDQAFDNMYKSEERLGKFFKYFSVLAIFIAALGLFGMSAFIAQSRTKEIGIRKVLGSSVSKILLLLSGEFAKWVLIANIIAIPVGYYGMNKWLQSFAYKINLTPDIFILSAIFSFLIAFLTVSYHSLKTASQNPVHSLRYE